MIKTIGGTADDYTIAIALDSSPNIYIAGLADSQPFDGLTFLLEYRFFLKSWVRELEE